MLEEAIIHCEEVAEENEGMCRVEKAMGLGLQNDEMMKCASEHRQLAEWLRELKAYREAKCEISDMADWHMNNGQEDIAMVISLDALAIISKHIEEVNADE